MITKENKNQWETLWLKNQNVNNISVIDYAVRGDSAASLNFTLFAYLSHGWMVYIYAINDCATKYMYTKLLLHTS